MMLGHSLGVGKKRLRKGHWLTEEDVQSLTSAGIDSVFAGTAEPDDIPENTAAEQLAQAIAGQELACEMPHTGRCNLIALTDGLFCYDRGQAIALNAIDPRITAALLPPYSTVRRGDLVATIKIIPFAVPSALIDRSCELARTPQLCQVAPFLKSQADFLETRLPAVKPLPEKVITFTTARAERVHLNIQSLEHCDHAPEEVSAWIKDVASSRADNAVLLIFGASATVDEADVIPAAIRLAGGTVDRVGMAADPGNLLVYGRLGTKHIIGLPGCAKSPALNGFDWVLERCAAGLTITPHDWAEMSVGGLLKEIEARPQLRQPVPTLPP